jgi:Rrf2 family protein
MVRTRQANARQHMVRRANTMQLGKASVYGIFGTLYLAAHEEEGYIQGKEIAAAYKMPLGYLLWSLQRLARAGILKSTRGLGGGFVLGRPSGKITLLEIIETVEGPVGKGWILGRETRFPKRLTRKFTLIRDDVLDHARTRLDRITIKQLLG